MKAASVRKGDVISNHAIAPSKRLVVETCSDGAYVRIPGKADARPTCVPWFAIERWWFKA